MQTWKEAFWIATFKLRTQIGYLLLGWGLVIFIGGTFLSSFYSYLEQPTIFFDFIFIAYFTFFPFWTRPKQLQSQKISGSFWAVPFFVSQLLLPITKSTIIKRIHFPLVPYMG